jgi:serine/threonine-protein kinase
MKKIGRYTITGLLGKGGMGKVFKVTYPVTGKVAALKLLDPSPLLAELTSPKDLKEQFTREAVIMASIRHPHVVDVLDFCQTDGQLYYLMDFFCNSLGTLMGESGEAEQARVIPIEKAVRYALQTLKGLHCLHFFHIIHKDIKPANMLITDQDTVRICDFGLSSRRGERQQERHAGIRVGSPFYAAPEQETDPDHVDVTADIYSMGVMLFKMLTGQLPDKSGPPVSHLNPDLDGAWDRFLACAMHPAPAKRFQSAEIMEKHLRDLARTWEEKKEKACAMPERFETSPDVEAPPCDDEQSRGSGPVRSAPAKVPLKQARDGFNLNRFMQPAHFAPDTLKRVGDDLVHDFSTGLTWQRSGTAFPVTWHQAESYVARLNAQAFGGYSDWRLPTLPELLTLARPPKKGRDHCVSPLFDTEQNRLWSVDKSTFVSAWYLDLEMGFAGRNDLTGFYHVKAVRSAN